MSLLSLLWLTASAALALDGSDRLELTMAGGVLVDGAFLRATPDSLLLSPEAGEIIEVPLVLIEAATINGESMATEALRAEAAAAWQQSLLFSSDPGPMPHPAGVAAASMLFAGTGHAMLGDWKAAGGYAAVEGVVLGTIALNVALEDPRPLPALIALDVIFKIWAAQEAARTAKRRREIARRADEAARLP
jgi:hypothetical protein